VFDGVWSKKGVEVRAVLSIPLDGDHVTVVRTETDGGSMTYVGIKIGLEVSGSYPGGRWSATIR
jgi:hypothetical protein